MQAIQSLLALHVNFSFQAPLTFGSKWLVLLSSPCLRKVHKCLPFGGSKASFSQPLLVSVRPMPWRFRPHSSKSTWLHMGAFSRSPLHTWFPVVASWLETYHHRSDSQHPCIKTMVWTCTDGLHEPFPTLIKLLIIVGRVSGQLGHQI